jgi:hypothetical protein
LPACSHGPLYPPQRRRFSSVYGGCCRLLAPVFDVGSLSYGGLGERLLWLRHSGSADYFLAMGSVDSLLCRLRFAAASAPPLRSGERVRWELGAAMALVAKPRVSGVTDVLYLL